MSLIRRLPFAWRDLFIALVLGALVATVAFMLRLGPQQVTAQLPQAIDNILGSVSVPQTPLTAQSAPEDVRTLMLHSHELWRTLYGEATVSWLNSQDEMSSFAEIIQVQQFGRVRMEHGPVGGQPILLWVTNGASTWKVDLIQKTYTHEVVPPSARSLDTYGPPSLPNDMSPVVIMHPLASQIPSYIAENLFPFGTAQSIEHRSLAVLGEDAIAGRAVVILSAESYFEGVLDSTELYWVDATTGIVLKDELYTGAPESGRLVKLIYFDAVIFDEPITGDPFSFQPGSDFTQVPPES